MSWVEVRTDPATHQAVCSSCGWHTVPMLNEKRANAYAAKHAEHCPSPPPPRNGATAECGCWTYDAMPGQTLGDRVVCPEHGDTRFAAMTVGCPQPDPGGRWIAAPPDPESDTR